MVMLHHSATERICKRFGIPLPKQALAKTPDSAVRAARRIGYPIALKISSPDIVHKTDVRGLFLDLKTEKDVCERFKEILANVKRRNPKARIAGILVQKMVSGVETIIGAKQDATFGPVVMFGLGGIFVEVLKDVTFRLAPLERRDAQQMIREIKGYPILAGIRERKPVNFRALEDTLIKVSKLIWTHSPAGLGRRPFIEELDINPLFAGPKRAVAADVRIII